MNTKIIYKYTDAGNYKVWGEEVIKGELTLNQLTAYFIDSEFFIPRDIGLPDLQPHPRTEDDHDLHTIEELEATADKATIRINAETLINSFRKARDGEWGGYPKELIQVFLVKLDCGFNLFFPRISNFE